ncbi:uncharacterized protein OCT59_008825 [Rhizophagus irregularis]|uniref:Uncharacterized protein n=5 Tax=Rhizophagus irregularis TaxID=588596 RepID=A0A015KYA0_RHIIW|nr:hypothetical protein RirG_068430 [Rhizophagus irregularis DAOM 197198w]UZO17470.1 hypothetical protein OCT59_008825 [Rhizophagus irregularis]GBC24097.1 hypothetical protein GLOIN_2v1578576 [Rhizophagus irregularis DAOM 181602=DAOM 197198]
MISNFVLFSTKVLFRHSLKPHTNLGILRLGRIHSYKNNNKPSIGNIFNNNSRKFHNNRTCLSLVQKTLKEELKEEDNNIVLENEELFPTTLLQEETLKLEQTLMIPKGVSKEFYDHYMEIFNKTLPTTPLHEFPRRGRLNNLIYHIKTREEALLLLKVIPQWRKKLLPITSVTTRLLIIKCCEFNAVDVVFNMLIDRMKYALLPNREGFRLIMLTFANKIIDPTSEDEIHSDNKQEILDNLYKTFGLMEYYDVSQYDAYIYTILISTSLKLNNLDRVDITTSEFLENFDKMILEISPISFNEKEENELKIRNDKFFEYNIESRISRLKSCIEMVNILDKWYTETKQDTKKAESFRNLKENWDNEIKKLQNSSS